MQLAKIINANILRVTLYLSLILRCCAPSVFATPIPLAEIERLALEEVARQGGHTNDVEVVLRPTTNEYIDVTVWQLPSAPGGFFVLWMTPEGEVLRFHRGR